MRLKKTVVVGGHVQLKSATLSMTTVREYRCLDHRKILADGAGVNWVPLTW